MKVNNYIKFILIALFFLVSCMKQEAKNQLPEEDISRLLELSLTMCPDIKQHFHFEIPERRNIYIEFKGIKNPLTRDIKCFGFLVKNKTQEIGKQNNLIQVLDYHKINDNQFYILYKISNQNAVNETTIKNIKGKWVLLTCEISEIKSI